MEGGYSTYCKDFMPTCAPQTYTKMKDKRYVQDNAQCESIMYNDFDIIFPSCHCFLPPTPLPQC